MKGQKSHYNRIEKTIYSVGISNKNCLLLIPPYVLLVNVCDYVVCFALIQKLHNFSGLFIWCLEVKRDGVDYDRYILGESQESYHRALFQLYQQYVRKFN